MLFWSRHVAEVMSISQVQGTQLPLRMVLGERYRHVDFQIADASWTLDNISIIGELFRRGNEVGQSLFDELRSKYFDSPTELYFTIRQQR